MSLTFLRGQQRFMRGAGFELYAVSSPGGALTEFAQREDVQAFAVAMERRIAPLRDIVAIWRLIILLRRLKPSILHAHTPKAGLLAMVAGAAVRLPRKVYHLRGLAFETSTGFKRRLLISAERVSCALADRVLVVGRSLREAAIAEGIAPPQKLQVLAYGSGQGVDALGRFNPDTMDEGTRGAVRSRLQIPADAQVIGFVGRLVRDKGIIDLSMAWQSIRADPRVHLLIVGPFEPDDPVPPGCRTLLESDPRVHLIGADWDTPKYYAAMDVLALPTYREGFPNVPLEAAAMRLPVVATRVTGCLDAVVDGETGRLVEARDSRQLESALMDYVRNPTLALEHGQAGRSRVLRCFQPDRLWKALLGVYRELCSDVDSQKS